MYSKFPRYQPERHVTGPVQLFLFIADLDHGRNQRLLTQCSLQLCLCLFCNQTQFFIYLSGEALYGECSYIEEKAVYVIIIHSKTTMGIAVL